MKKIKLEDITEEMMECVDGDGHTICYDHYFTDKGWPKEYIDQISYVHESDGSPKGSIWNNGELVEECKGVYCLDFHRKVARDLECEGTTKMGRGFQAQELSGQIWKKWKQLNENT